MSGLLAARNVQACSTILAGKAATVDGSVLMATSCDGNMMGRVYTQPATTCPGGTGVPMFFDFPAPQTCEDVENLRRKGDTCVGNLPVEATYRCILAAGHLGDSITGGINEHGLSMGIEYMTMKPELANRKGIVSTCSSHWTTSLIANGLLRAKTAREAISLMGAMVTQYGFTYYWAPDAGCAIPVVDKTEAWMMEIFGPGKDWTPGSGAPGAVWCAQRVPDGHVTCNTNRSRIAEVTLEDTDAFMASSNIHSLAEKLGYWKPGEPFIWHDAYGTVGTRANSLREWAALNSFAPSLHLKATCDPNKDRYPFSVRPDETIGVHKLATVMRDDYQGTPFDVTEHPAFNPGGRKSPLARPFGSRELFDLVGIEPERCIGTEASGYVYIAQVRDGLPDLISGCLWFTLGPSYTSCFAPIYSGATELPESWSRRPDFARMDRAQVQWKFQLAESLAGLKYQAAIEDVRGVYEPAEKRFLALQADFEEAAVRVLRDQGEERAAAFVTEYTRACLESVDDAYGELVDVLMFKYLYRYADAAPPDRVGVRSPAIPPLPG